MSEVARKLKERSRKTVTLPSSGLEVVISKLDQERFLAAGGKSILAVIKDLERNPDRREYNAERAKMSEEDAIQYVKSLVAASVLSPRVWTGDVDQCPEDQVTMIEFAEDLPFLVDQINLLNNLTPEAAEKADSFREGSGGDSGSPGSAVPGAPDGSPQAVAVGADVEPGDLPESKDGATVPAP